MPLQIRRGTTAQRLTITPLPGELIYDTSTGQIFVGNGTVAGGTITTGISLEDAADTAAALFTSGSHTGITFTYNDVAGRIDATAVGPFLGDLKGSVFADNSSIMVNAIDNTLSSDSVITNALASPSGTRIFVSDPMTLSADSAITTSTFNSDALADISQHHGNSDVRPISLSRSRGSELTPTTVQAGDLLSKLSFVGYDGTGYILSSQIRGSINPDATVSTNALAGQIDFLFNGNDGVIRSRIEIDSGKTVHYNQFWGVTAVPNGLPMYLLQNTSTVNNGARLAMRRSRGSYSAPTAVVNGDALFRLGWGGHDGTAYRDTAFITGTVANTVSTNVVPTKLTVSTTNSIGTLTTALEISEEQVLKINTVGSLSTTSVNFNNAVRLVNYTDTAARDIAIPTPAAGMVVYISGTGKFQGYNGSTSAWNDLN